MSNILFNAESRVNSYTRNTQFYQSTTTLSDGGWIVCWDSKDQDGSGYGVYAQRYNSNGTVNGEEFRVNTYTNGDQGQIASAALKDGGWIIFWASTNDGVYGIYAQRYNQDGLADGQEFRVSSYDNDEAYHSIATLEDGSWVISWTSKNQDSPGVYSQRYSQDGLADGQEFRVNTYTNSNKLYTDTTALKDGGWLTSWISATQDGSGYGIYAQRYNSDGTVNGDEFRVNTYTNSGQYTQSTTALKDGGWVTCWQSLSQDGSAFGVYAQHYNSNGTVNGSGFRVNTNTYGNQYDSSITALEDGGWIICWSSDHQTGSNQVYAQRYNQDGTVYGEEFKVTYDESANNFHPSIMALKDGGWIVSFATAKQDGNGYDIYTQRYSSDGTKILSVVTNEDLSITNPINATDLEGHTLTYSIKEGSAPQKGVVSFNQTNKTYTYTPNANENGDDSFIIKVNDGHGVISNLQINITIGAVNDDPTAALTTATTNEDTSLVIDPLASATDIDLDQLSLTAVTQGSHGSVIINNQKIIYTPQTNYNGSDKFSYIISDGKGGSVIKELTVTVNPVNDAPEATLTTATTNEDTSLVIDPLAYATDIDFDQLSLIARTPASHGRVIFLLSEQKIEYIPHSNYNGSDKFSYTISDGKGGTVTKELTVTVNPVDDIIIGTRLSEVITSSNADEIITGNGGHDNFLFTRRSGHDVITDFGGVGNSWNFGHDAPEYDTLRFSGAGLTANKMLITYDGTNTKITFEGINDLSVTLKNFDFTNLDNLPNTLNNILFNNENESYSRHLINNPANEDRRLDSYDVFNDHSSNAQTSIWNLNSVTFLNEANNTVSGLENSNDVINGMAGNDIIHGRSGNDLLRGQEGNDTLYGDEGNDIINGGAGADILNGGSGNDIFTYNNISDSTHVNSDIILDFVKSQDKIDLSNLNLHFEDLIITHQPNDTVIEFQNSELEIKFQGQFDFDNQDFIF